MSDNAANRVIAGRYQLLSKLGAGGMGMVYLARQIGVGNQVAIKFLPLNAADDPLLRKRLEREAALSLQVAHPGAAQLLDAGQDDDGQIYLVFEYVAGEDLSTLLDREGALPFRDAMDITLQIAQVLAFAHGRGIVHRDIKPPNIRLRRDIAGWHVKILDFGIARFMDSAASDALTRLTMEGTVAGSPRYMAPEQIEGREADARSDVYALGLILFEMVSGREAFDQATISQIMWAQLHEAVPPLRLVQTQRDAPELDALIAQACAKSPERRFSTMQALVGAIRSVQEGGAPAWGAAQPVKRRHAQTTSTPTPATPLPQASDLQIPLAVSTPRPMRTLTSQRVAVETAMDAPRLFAWKWIAIGIAVGVAVSGLGALGFAWHYANDEKQAQNAPAAVPVPATVPEVAKAPVPAPAPTPFAVPLPKIDVAPMSTSTKAPTPAPMIEEESEVTVETAPAPKPVPAKTPEIAPQANANTNVDNKQPVPDCPGTANAEPALSKASTGTLEKQANAVRSMSPSVTARWLAQMQAHAQSRPAEARECAWRTALVEMILNDRALLASSPVMWGNTRNVQELESLFLRLPLRANWSTDQRRSVLTQLESQVIAQRIQQAPGDGDFWRRRYYGLLLNCEVDEAQRATLGAPRPREDECPKLRPQS
jgi:eukaryotic-like serine/threonine-protein kinase